MITSRHNAVVQSVRSLQRKRPHNRFMLEGPHLLVEALDAGIRIETLLCSPRAESPVLGRARAVAERTVEVSDDILEYAADSQHPQGLLAVAEVPQLALSDASARNSRLLLLDEIRDPGNLGTIARSAWASGVAAVLLAGRCVDAWNPKVVRAAAGALFRLPLLAFEHRAAAGEWLRARGQRAVMATARGRQSCFDMDWQAPVTIVLGSEAHGVHPDTAAFCSDSVHIPMVPECESLNLAASAAILCYLARGR